MKSTIEKQKKSEIAGATKMSTGTDKHMQHQPILRSKSKASMVVALAILVLCEIAVYWLSVRQSGFYLDDWTMMSYLHFAPQDFSSLVSRSLADNRILPRPLEALHFPLVWMAFKANPQGYHIFNCALEVLAGLLIYLTVSRFSTSRIFALTAALIFLVYPIHDATHYWMVATSVVLSLVLYLGSLLSTVKFAETGRRSFLLASVCSFAASVFNYEAFAPLCVVNGVAAYLIVNTRKEGGALKSALTSFAVLAPVCLGLVLYQRVIASTFGSNFVPPHQLDVAHFFDVMVKGLAASLSPGLLGFAIDRAKDAVAVGISAMQMWLLAGLIASIFGAFAFFEINRSSRSEASCNESESYEQSYRDCLNILILGCICLLASYTIFGVARGYDPQLASIYNRVNTGAAVGASLIFAAIFTWLSRKLNSKVLVSSLPVRGLIRGGVAAVVLVPLLLLSSFADWGMANQWRRSWDVQKRIASILKSHRSELKPGDSVILVNVPRYVMWSPVFDGVWDFQAMMRLCLDNEKVNGGVASSRLQVTRNKIEDVSMGFSCAKYNYKRMFVLIPHPEEFVQVHSADEFINIVQNKGMYFGLSQSVVDGWKKTASNN